MLVYLTYFWLFIRGSLLQIPIKLKANISSERLVHLKELSIKDRVERVNSNGQVPYSTYE